MPPVKPNFINEYEKENKKDIDINESKNSNDTSDKSDNEQAENEKIKKKFNPAVGIFGIVLIGLIGGGIYLKNSMKNGNIDLPIALNAASATDSATTEDKGNFEYEADVLFDQYNHKMNTTRETFKEDYIKLRKEEYTKDEAFWKVFLTYTNDDFLHNEKEASIEEVNEFDLKRSEQEVPHRYGENDKIADKDSIVYIEGLDLDGNFVDLTDEDYGVYDEETEESEEADEELNE